MSFVTSTADQEISFSEMVNNKEIFVTSKAPLGSTRIAMVFSEKQIRQLKNHLIAQLKKINKAKNDTSI